MLEKRKSFWTGFILVSTLAFLVIAYLPILGSPLFTVDDESLLKIPQLAPPLTFKSVESLFRFNQHIDYYPVRDLSYALDVALWGDSLLLARVHQILLFWFSAVLMNLVLLELTVPWAIALGGTVVWAIHPYHSETLIWLSARKDVLALLFGLLSVFLYLKACKLRSHWLFAGALGAFIGSLLSKASMTPLPLIAALMLPLGDRSRRIPAARITLLCSLVVAGISALGQSWFYSHVNDMRNLIPLQFRIETSLTALGKMASGWFIPSINGVENDTFGEWTANNDPYLWVGVVLWITYFCFFAYALWRRHYPRIVGLVAIGLLYLPISGLLFPHREFYSTRYLEPVSLVVGFLLLIEGGVRIRQPSKRLVVAFALILGLVGISTVREASHWRDPLAIRLHALEENPSSISLKAYTLNEVINSLSFSSNVEKAPLITVRDQLKAELAAQCEELSRTDKRSPDSPLVNCHPFFRTGYVLNREHGNGAEADRYFALFEQASSLLKPAPKMVERLRFEKSLMKNKVDLKQVEKWLAANPYLPNSDYRMLHLIGTCLLNTQPQGQIVRDWIEKRLLMPNALPLFLKETVAPSLRPQLEACLELSLL